ncbi:MAG: hypothetical protein M0Q13_11020 [Methanothrix sp.]|nr:hypothetical protein [Methanothrix sp.]
MSKVVARSCSLGPHGRGRERLDGCGRARAESCTGHAGMAKSAGIVMVRAVAGLVAGRTKIDRMVAMYVSYPRFFEQMAGLGARGAH